jgi:RNA polymerase sigma factor (sigma-70 family)
MNIDTKDLRFANMVIYCEVKKLRRRGILRTDETEPFASETLARLLAVWESYDAARGPREAFINTVVGNIINSLLRERFAQKRRGTTEPLNGVADTLVDRSESEHDREHLMSLRIDLSIAIRKLTPVQREIVDMLQRDTLTSVAVQLRVPRRTLRDECARIRGIFRDAGLEAYL